MAYRKRVVSMIGSIEPRPIVVVSCEFQAIDNSRPIEAGALVVALFHVGQVELRMRAVAGVDTRRMVSLLEMRQSSCRKKP